MIWTRWKSYEIFAVKSDSYPQDKVLAWLIYYVRSKRFYIELPAEIKQRFTRKISDVIPLPEHELLVFFIDKTTKKCNVDDILKVRRTFAPVYRDDSIFNSVKVLPGGYGVGWSESMELSDTELYRIGTDIPLSLNAFLSFLKNRTITVSEAASTLDCSRQNIENLVKRGKLHPIKSSPKNTLFAKQEIEQRCM